MITDKDYPSGVARKTIAQPITTGNGAPAASDLLVVSYFNDNASLTRSGFQTVDFYVTVAKDLVLDQTGATIIYEVQTGAWTERYSGATLPPAVIVANGTNYGQIMYLYDDAFSAYKAIGEPWR